MVELDHTFATGPDTWATITDLEKVVPCVEGGRVLEPVSDEEVKAEIVVKMGAMSMTFTGTVQMIERDDAAQHAVMEVRAKEKGGQGFANAEVTFDLNGDGDLLHTAAQITGKAASMGEGVVQSVLDALIKDFTGKLATA